MNLIEALILKHNRPSLLQPRRSQIYIGYKCNQSCVFCYYKSKIKGDFFPFDKIKAQIDFAIAYGITDFEITGGEPGIYPELMKVLEYIKELNPSYKIAIITNGSLLDFCKEHSEWKDYIDEFLVSLQAVSNFEQITGVDNVRKVLKCLELGFKNKKFIRTNTVLGSFNYKQANDILDLLRSISPNLVNLLPVNVWNDAKHLDKAIDYAKVRDIVKKAVDTFPIPVFARFIPFCKMEGYESHLVGNLQHIYDWFDWNPELLENLWLVTNPKQSLRELGEYGSTSLGAVARIQRHSYTKTILCKGCNLNYLCDGVEKTSGSILAKYIKPVTAYKEPIRNFMHFIGNRTEQVYKDWYNA
jgi:MoaA/NifB/PqqE/SkfB family radical SAM enzyme